MLNVKTFIFNMLQENTYVVSDDTKECVIIDCGAYYQEERDAITHYIDANALKPVHLLATHGHFDHNFGNDTIHDNYGLKVEIAAEDGDLINDLPKQFKEMIGVPLKREYPPVGRYLQQDEIIRFGHHGLRVMKTPGHSRGGVVFYSEDEHIIFTADTLFKMSVGRTDFDGGSYAELMNSLQTILVPLPPETTIFSGHGPKTTIGEELRYNPYLQ